MSEHTYTVVVGVSATSGSPAGLAWAAAQAAAHQGRLVAVRAWKLPSPAATPSGVSSGRMATTSSTEEQVREDLARDVEAVLGADHGAELRVVRGGRRKALLDTAREADLLVVDAPRGVPRTTAFAQRLVYAADCPVVIMPPRISGEPPTVMGRAANALGRNALKAAGSAGRPGYQLPPG